MRHLLFAAVLLGSAGSASADVTLTMNSDVAAGQAAFGPATDVFNYRNLFNDSATWTPGSFGGSQLISTTLSDPVAGGTFTTTSTSFFITNWVDGPGFDNGSAAAPDMAINGVENFTLFLPTPIFRLGFTISIGLGLLPGEATTQSGIFAINAFNNADLVGGLLDSFVIGGGTTYFASLESDVAFNRVTFQDAGNQQDEYFGNFVSGVPATGAIPEPASWAMLMAGFGLVGTALRRRRQAVIAY